MPPRLFFSFAQTKSVVNLFKKLFSSVSHEHGFPISPFLLSSLSFVPPFTWRGCRCWWCWWITTSFLWQWNTFDAVCLLRNESNPPRVLTALLTRMTQQLMRLLLGNISLIERLSDATVETPNQTWFIREKVQVLHLKLVKAYFEVQVTEAIAVSCLQTCCVSFGRVSSLGFRIRHVHLTSRRAEEIMQSINQCRHVKAGNKSRRKC